MRFATIDLGSNTVRLLVAEPGTTRRWRVIDHDQCVTRLGEGLARSGALGEVPMARTASVVAAYVDRATRLGAREVRIVATSAVREARNGAAFAASVARVTGRRVEVVSGEDEARLTLRGVACGLGVLGGRLLVFDIGGGSTEFILALDGAMRAAVSLRLGVVPLAEAFPFPGPVDWARYRAMADTIRARLEDGLRDAIPGAPVDHLVGTAGTVTTLAALDLELATYVPERVQGHRLEPAAIERLLGRLGALSVAERAALPCLEPGRADLIIPGIAIVQATMERFRAKGLLVSDAGLREGIMASVIDDSPDAAP